MTFWSILLGSCLALNAVITVSVAQSTPNLNIVISTKASTYKVGDPIDLKIVVENSSANSISLLKVPGEPGHAEAVNRIEVLNNSGTVLERIDGPTIKRNGRIIVLPKKWGSLQGFDLDAGTRFEDYAVLTTLFDLSRPGKYVITDRYETRSLGTHSDIKWSYFASNSITITIVP